jgi:hypothetical protein
LISGTDCCCSRKEKKERERRVWVKEVDEISNVHFDPMVKGQGLGDEILEDCKSIPPIILDIVLR